MGNTSSVLCTVYVTSDNVRCTSPAVKDHAQRLVPAAPPPYGPHEAPPRLPLGRRDPRGGRASGRAGVRRADDARGRGAARCGSDGPLQPLPRRSSGWSTPCSTGCSAASSRRRPRTTGSRSCGPSRARTGASSPPTPGRWRPCSAQPEPGAELPSASVSSGCGILRQRRLLRRGGAVAAFGPLIALNYGWSSFTAARELDPGRAQPRRRGDADRPCPPRPSRSRSRRPPSTGAYGSDEHYELVLDQLLLGLRAVADADAGRA